VFIVVKCNIIGYTWLRTYKRLWPRHY